MAIIKVNKLNKNYVQHKKEAGLKASFKSLFKREKIIKPAVKDLSFEIEEGELVGFLGPNGAGKTTTLKILSGILDPDSGSVSVMGKNPWQKEPEFKRNFSLVMGQKNQLWWDIPAIDSFELNKAIYGLKDKPYQETLTELTELLDLGEVLPVQVRRLSLGQRMKCELAAALLHRPKVIFLDEPTIGLDVVAQKNIREFIKKYNKKSQTTIILTSHYMEDIRELCKRVIIINHGSMIFDGQLKDLIDKHAIDKIIKLTFSQAVNEGDLKKFGQIKKWSSTYAELSVARPRTKEVAGALLSSSLPVEDIEIEEVDVDDIIRQIFNAHKQDETK